MGKHGWTKTRWQGTHLVDGSSVEAVVRGVSSVQVLQVRHSAGVVVDVLGSSFVYMDSTTDDILEAELPAGQLGADLLRLWGGRTCGLSARDRHEECKEGCSLDEQALQHQQSRAHEHQQVIVKVVDVAGKLVIKGVHVDEGEKLLARAHE